MDALGRLLYLTDNLPDTAGSDEPSRRTEPDWENTRRDLLLQLATATQDLRQADLRSRMNQARRILTDHTAAWNMVGQPESRSRHIACTHALECIGAFRRGEPLPPTPTAFTETIDAIATWNPASSRAAP
jgi:hypothetical protein